MRMRFVLTISLMSGGLRIDIAETYATWASVHQERVLYPFFAAMSAGSASRSGIGHDFELLFAAFQNHAQQLGLSTVLITTANSTGGVRQNDRRARDRCRDGVNMTRVRRGAFFAPSFWHSSRWPASWLIVLAQAYLSR